MRRYRTERYSKNSLSFSIRNLNCSIFKNAVLSTHKKCYRTKCLIFNNTVKNLQLIFYKDELTITYPLCFSPVLMSEGFNFIILCKYKANLFYFNREIVLTDDNRHNFIFCITEADSGVIGEGYRIDSSFRLIIHTMQPEHLYKTGYRSESLFILISERWSKKGDYFVLTKKVYFNLMQMSSAEGRRIVTPMKTRNS